MAKKLEKSTTKKLKRPSKPLVGTIRVKAANLKLYEFTKTGWKLSKRSSLDRFAGIFEAINLFVAEKNLNILIDKANPRFLKGQLSPKGIVQGARINILPNGDVLEKAFSLFAPYLKIHDQKSHDHWDVIYQNKGGTWSYVYTLEKRQRHRNIKYKKVDEFEKVYRKLKINAGKNLLNDDDFMAVPMYTLLRTYMRVGNKTYLKAHGHKGLTTLTKQNISIDGNTVTFTYSSKGGVPIVISQKFPDAYILRLKSVLNSIANRNRPVFSKKGCFLCERDFKNAFIKYCGKEFYPHIVRSHYATMKVKKFLSKNGRRKVSKNVVNDLFMMIAHDLGHKKYDKKTGQWKEHYVVTVNSYIQPKLVEKVNKLIC